MTSTLERLRRLKNLRTPGSPAREFASPAGKGSWSVDVGIPGQEIVAANGACYVSTHAYPLQEPRGGAALGALLDHPPDVFARLHPNFNLNGIDSFRRAVFLDTETTGLGTGASVYAFMVGIGTFETPSLPQESMGLIADESDLPVQFDATPSAAPSHFVVRQFFMRNPAEELALLSLLAYLLQDGRLVVTFNGRSFDLPLLRSRIRYNTPFLSEQVRATPLYHGDAPHLDLLMPARRLWKRRLQSCRLANLEQMILGHERTEDDVPGYQIPQLYADYLRTGDAREMERVFYHNREDIVSMVSLATRLAEAFGRSQGSARDASLHGQDWLSLGTTYERVDDWAQAEAAYLRAFDSAANGTDRAEILFRMGRLQKRQGRWHEASETWQLWLTSVPGNDPAPYVELAKYCEWQLQDYEQAEMWTAWALHNLQQEESEFAWSRTISELEHRLHRIRRKRGQH